MFRLTLFFTRGVSLADWSENGSLEREIAIYLRLQQKGVGVCFVTYGNTNDLAYEKELHGIKILCNKWNLPPRWYECLLPLLFPLHFLQNDMIKTNQTNGADVALRVATFWRKPLIARCGYMWSDFAALNGKQAEEKRAREIEQHVFPNAQRVVVTTSAMKEYVIRQSALAAEQIQVIPNYVLTDMFSAGAQEPHPNRICSVGRFSEQKNQHALIQACAGLDVELILIGEGPLRASLQAFAKQLGVTVSLPGNLPHHQLPDIIRQSAIFTLVSQFEGHPKSLIEAMSCGVAVLGADVPGIREQIQHAETGWLCGKDVHSIRNAIQHLLAHPELRQKLGRNARRFVEENYALDKIVEMEYSLLQSVVDGAR